jgi:hypothetical protein
MLSYDLKKVLALKGPQLIQENGIFKFNKNIIKIPNIDEIKMEKIAKFIRVSQDENLHKETKKQGKLFCSSTSSINDLLVPFHFIIHDKETIEMDGFTKGFKSKYSPFIRNGSKVKIKFKDGIYVIEAVEKTGSNVLMQLGHVLELFLTTNETEFSKYLKSSDNEPQEITQSYHFANVRTGLI